VVGIFSVETLGNWGDEALRSGEDETLRKWDYEILTILICKIWKRLNENTRSS